MALFFASIRSIPPSFFDLSSFLSEVRSANDEPPIDQPIQRLPSPLQCDPNPVPSFFSQRGFLLRSKTNENVRRQTSNFSLSRQSTSTSSHQDKQQQQLARQASLASTVNSESVRGEENGGGGGGAGGGEKVGGLSFMQPLTDMNFLLVRSRSASKDTARHIVATIMPYPCACCVGFAECLTRYEVCLGRGAEFKPRIIYFRLGTSRTRGGSCCDSGGVL